MIIFFDLKVLYSSEEKKRDQAIFIHTRRGRRHSTRLGLRACGLPLVLREYTFGAPPAFLQDTADLPSDKALTLRKGGSSVQ